MSRQTIEDWAADQGARHRRRMWARFLAYVGNRIDGIAGWLADFWPALKLFGAAFLVPLIPCAGLVWGLWRLAGGGAS